MTSNRRRAAWAASILGLALHWACQTDPKEYPDTFGFTAGLADTLANLDSALIVLKDSGGEVVDTLFRGPVKRSADLADLEAPHYQGGPVRIDIIGYAEGIPVYQAEKRFDPATGKTDGTRLVRVPGATITLDSAAYTLFEGGEIPLPKTRLSPAGLLDTSLIWTVDHPETFAVSGAKLIAFAAGDGTLRVRLASDTTVRAEAAIKVLARNTDPEKPQAPEELSVTPDTLDLAVDGASGQLTAKVFPSSADKAMRWRSSDSGIATVGSNGDVRGRGEGLAWIVAVSARDTSARDSAHVRVTAPAKVDSVVFAKDSLVLYAGGTAESLTVKVWPARADQAVSLGSDDPETVQLQGAAAKGLKPGAAWVRARSRADSSRGDSLRVIVKEVLKVDGVDIESESLLVYLGGPSAAAKARVRGAGGAMEGGVHWSVRPPGIAAVDDTGRVSAIAPGRAWLYALSRADSSGRDSIPVTVRRDPPRLSVGRADTAVAVGKSVTFRPRVAQDFGTLAICKWDLDGDKSWDDSAAAFPDSLSRDYPDAGEFPARFYARDGEGNDTLATVRVRAVKGPVVEILSPADGLRTRERVLDVVWTVNGNPQDSLTKVSLKEGPNPIVRGVTDAAGTLGSATVTVWWDTTPPARPVNRGPAYDRTRRPEFRWTTGGGGAGAYRARLDDPNLEAVAVMADTFFTPPTLIVEGVHTLYVQERDAAGNWSRSAAFSLLVDTLPPPAPMVSPAHAYFTNAFRPLFLWIPGGSDSVRYEVALDTTVPAGILAVDSTRWAPSEDWGEVRRSLYVRAVDSAANRSLWARLAVHVDRKPPPRPVFASVPKSPLNSVRPRWSWRSAGSAEMGIFRTRLNASNFSSGAADTAYQPPIGIPEGAHAFEVQERDSAGNWSQSVVDSVHLILRKGQGGSIGSHGVAEPILAISPQGQRYLACADGKLVKVFRWDGAAWTSIFADTAYAGTNYNLSLIAAPNGNLYLGFQHFTPVPAAYSTPVKVWDGSVWIAMDPPGGGTGNRISIAWDAYNGTLVSAIGSGELLSLYRHQDGAWKTMAQYAYVGGSVTQVKVAANGKGTVWVAAHNYTGATGLRLHQYAANGTLPPMGVSPEANAGQHVGLGFESDGFPRLTYMTRPTSKVFRIGSTSAPDTAGLAFPDAYQFAIWQGTKGPYLLTGSVKSTVSPMAVQVLENGAWVQLTPKGFANGYFNTDSPMMSVAVDPEGIPWIAFADSKSQGLITVLPVSWDP